MGFEAKQWKDRVSEYPARRTLKNLATGEETTVEVQRNEGAVHTTGDRLNAEAMNGLEKRIQQAFEDAGAQQGEAGETLAAHEAAIAETTNALQAHESDVDNPHKLTPAAIGAAAADALLAHTESEKNPHGVTAGQIGAASADAFASHEGDTGNPHGVTAEQVGATGAAAFALFKGGVEDTLAGMEQSLGEAGQQLAGLQQAAEDTAQELEAVRKAAEDTAQGFEEVRQAAEGTAQAVEEIRKAAGGNAQGLEEVRRTTGETQRELAALQTTVGSVADNIDEVRQTADATAASLAGLAQTAEGTQGALVALEEEMRGEISRLDGRIDEGGGASPGEWVSGNLADPGGFSYYKMAYEYNAALGLLILRGEAESKTVFTNSMALGSLATAGLPAPTRKLTLANALIIYDGSITRDGVPCLLLISNTGALTLSATNSLLTSGGYTALHVETLLRL